ncbi:hypothetical protein [Paractinoplanes durhamensis]|uniref:hypothetical protein n=1 Tax=Paractinoplanes durhamensis TaxID=113563 RepID=UPI003637A677
MQEWQGNRHRSAIWRGDRRRFDRRELQGPGVIARGGYLHRHPCEIPRRRQRLRREKKIDLHLVAALHVKSHRVGVPGLPGRDRGLGLPGEQRRRTIRADTDRARADDQRSLAEPVAQCQPDMISAQSRHHTRPDSDVNE